MNARTKKSICFIVSTPDTINAFMLNHLKYLSAFFDIHIVVNCKDKNEILSEYTKSIHHIEIVRGINLLKDISALFKLYYYLIQNNFDAVHTITPKAGFLGIVSARLASVPNRIHIFTGQVWHTRTGFMRYFLKSLDRIIVFLSTNILVDGKSQRNFLIAEKVLKENNSIVLGAGSISGVSISKYQKNHSLKNHLKYVLGIKENEIVFVFLGRLNHDKGVYDLLEAFNALNQKHSNTKLIIAGPDEENVIAKINAKISNAILLIGQTKFPENILQIADVFCLPSHREGFGTCVIEASMLEIPIICSNTYGLNDSIVERVTGLRHKVADPISLQNNMEELLLNKQLRTRLGKNGKLFVESNFNADYISNCWLDFYQNLLNKKTSIDNYYFVNRNKMKSNWNYNTPLFDK